MTSVPQARARSEILIAEDSPTQAQLLRGLLEQHGYAVVAVANGQEALAAARRSKPALIISDVVMPGTDGYELCNAVKTDPDLRDIPVMLVTTLSHPEDVIRGLECGADNFIRKPFDETQLITRVEYLLVNRRLRKTHQSRLGLEIRLGGKAHFIGADRQQILDLLISTYEQAVHMQNELLRHEQDLATANETLVGLTEAAERAERRLRDIANSVPGAIYRLRIQPDGSSRFEFISDGVKELRHVDAATALRDAQAVWDTVVEADRPALNAAAAEAVRLLKPLQYDFRVRLPDGSIKWLRTLGSHRREPDGSIVRIGYWSDVTAEKALESSLQQAKDAADEANRAKSAFLAAMSHEIRTPMNGVLGMLELLRQTPLNAEQRSMVDVIDESGHSLQRIIDDILDFSKIEAGRLDVTPMPTDVPQLVERVSRLYLGAASRKGLLLRYHVDPRISRMLLVDGQRLRQILGNLISNAVKFTHAGRVEVSAEFAGRDDGADAVHFRVKDTGIGVSKEDQGRLFQPFVQAQAPGGLRTGTGLGLTISQRLARLMGGLIHMQSEPGAGTTMTLELTMPHAQPQEHRAVVPAGGAPTLPGNARAPSVKQAEAAGSLVLVVDDHPTNCVVLKSQLKALGYAALTAENGTEALELMKTRRFGLVVADCNMPGMDGYTLARAIRHLEQERGAARVPIIACTANAMKGEAEACYAAGMDDYLAKPATMAQIREKVERFLPGGSAAKG